jgi:1-deoxy-D-xylulose-5-phosphate synthase
MLVEGADGAIITEGNLVYRALEVCDRLKQAGKSFAVVNARFLKPLDKELLLDLAKKYKVIYTLEDNVISGGFGSSILELFSCNGIEADVKIIGFDDSFIPHGEKEELYSLKSIDCESIFNRIMKE